MIFVGQYVDDVAFCECDLFMIRQQTFDQLLVFFPELGDSPQLIIDSYLVQCILSIAMRNLICLCFLINDNKPQVLVSSNLHVGN